MRPIPSASRCQGLRGCKNPPTAGTPNEPRRFVKVTRRGKVVYLHVCKGCFARHQRTGSFRRERTQAWTEGDEARAVQLRRVGRGIREISKRLPHIPERTLYHMFHRAGLRGRAG